jgi:hypothetical protein
MKDKTVTSHVKFIHALSLTISTSFAGLPDLGIGRHRATECMCVKRARNIDSTRANFITSYVKKMDDIVGIQDWYRPADRGYGCDMPLLFILGNDCTPIGATTSGPKYDFVQPQTTYTNQAMSPVPRYYFI